MFGSTRKFSIPVVLGASAGILCFGAVGVTWALTGAGAPFALAGIIAGIAVGLVQCFVARALMQAAAAAPSFAAAAAKEGTALTDAERLAAYQAQTATLRHDLRGVLSPALMMSDRLLNHSDPTVQRAGQSVVKSIDRATGLIMAHRDALAPESEAGPDAPSRATR